MMLEPDPLPGGELAAFVAAFEAGSVQGAADTLGLTQSAVTKRLQALERRVGVELLERGRHGARATDAGRVLYPEAKHALGALLRARTVVVEQRDQAVSSLAVAASHTIGEFLLPGWLAEFRASGADVRAQVEIVNSPGVLTALREERAQLGFVEGLDDLAGFVSMTVARDEIVAVVGPGHRWAKRRKVRARELVQEPYFTRESGSGTRAIAADALAHVGVELEAAMEVASAQSVKRAVASGGFGLLSSLAVEAEVRAGSLHALEVSGVELARELRAVHVRGASPRGSAKRFWTWLTETRAGGGRPTSRASSG